MNENKNPLATKLAIRLVNVELELADVQVVNDQLQSQVNALQKQLSDAQAKNTTPAKDDNHG